MCDFNTLDEASKETYHKQLSECAVAFGGINFFLQLLEAVRKAKPHPLLAKHSEFTFSHGSIKWNKVIFKDKLSLLMKVRVNENKNGNLIPSKEDPSYKNVMNLLRTLHPLKFEVTPKSTNEGEGFSVHPFDEINAYTTRLNPVFDVLFFCSIDTVKKILNFESKTK
jgi:hypothetical protein